MRRIIIVLSLFCLVSCGGTGTGNPGITNTSSGVVTASAAILQSICTLLASCAGGPTFSSCVSGIQNTSGLDVKLGLSPGTFSNFLAIEAAESAGTIQANATAATLCESQVSSLSCSNTAVQAAYQAGQSNPYLSVPGMIPTAAGSCISVF